MLAKQGVLLLALAGLLAGCASTISSIKGERQMLVLDAPSGTAASGPMGFVEFYYHEGKSPRGPFSWQRDISELVDAVDSTGVTSTKEVNLGELGHNESMFFFKGTTVLRLRVPATTGPHRYTRRIFGQGEFLQDTLSVSVKEGCVTCVDVPVLGIMATSARESYMGTQYTYRVSAQLLPVSVDDPVPVSDPSQYFQGRIIHKTSVY